MSSRAVVPTDLTAQARPHSVSEDDFRLVAITLSPLAHEANHMTCEHTCGCSGGSECGKGSCGAKCS